jgi:hypothetical protein
MAARRQALRLAARALEQRLNADTSDHAGPELPCSRGEPARYRGRHEKTFESVLGPLRLERAYYHCPGCQAGFCPRDRALRLELYSLTPGVLRMTGSTAALVSFEESSALLHELAGVEVSVSQVQRAAEALGAEIAVDERVCVERLGEVAPTMYWGWMAPACRCAPPKSPAAPASRWMAPRKPARPRWSRCGARNRGMRRVGRCGTPIDRLFSRH